jgi:hypothetical protein
LLAVTVLGLAQSTASTLTAELQAGGVEELAGFVQVAGLVRQGRQDNVQAPRRHPGGT